MTDERLTELLKFQKEHLAINWNEDDELIKRKMKRSMKYLNDISGSELSFEDDSIELELMFERVRYDWNNSLDEFKTNFGAEIRTLILLKAVGKFEEN